jgi:prevent-host-death family protein
MTRRTVIDAARTFSDVLDCVAAGEEIEVTRRGAAVAVIGPPKTSLVSAERFRALIAAAPPLDKDFADEVRSVRKW